MRIVCVSDTHCQHLAIPVPDGDVLVHAGDFCDEGGEHEVQLFAEWLQHLPHRSKVVIAGNHDFLFQDQPELARGYMEGVFYLQDSGCEINGLRFWGSPWQPWFMNWAFNLLRGEQLRERWGQIPHNTDVLVTHGPPHGVLDQVRPRPESTRFRERIGSGPLGCDELRKRIAEIRPSLHVFGHIHDSHGTATKDGTIFANASICGEGCRPNQAAIVVDAILRNGQWAFEVV